MSETVFEVVHGIARDTMLGAGMTIAAFTKNACVFHLPSDAMILCMIRFVAAVEEQGLCCDVRMTSHGVYGVVYAGVSK